MRLYYTSGLVECSSPNISLFSYWVLDCELRDECILVLQLRVLFFISTCHCLFNFEGGSLVSNSNSAELVLFRRLREKMYLNYIKI